MKPAQAGALTTPLPESCRAASSARIASRRSGARRARRSWRMMPAAPCRPCPPWSAVTLASRLASCAATKASVARPSRAFAILVSTSSGVSNPSTVESRAASALASALPRRPVAQQDVVVGPLADEGL